MTSEQISHTMTKPQSFIPIAKPLLGEAELEAVKRPLSSGWVTQGREVAAFEVEFAELVGAAHACAVSSCTAALHLALHVLGVSPGDEVITVSHSFIASANVIRYCGATPVFIDIEATGYNVDTRLLAEAITEKTKAIIAVHQLGMPCDLASILAVAAQHNIAVVEDAACALGSQLQRDGCWSNIGAPLGDIACFSFHPRKLITTGDGGMLTTNRSGLAERLGRLRQHGMDVNDRIRHASSQVINEHYSELGFNYRLTDIQAAIGREQLKRLPAMVQQRRALAVVYQAELSAIEGLGLPLEPDWARSNWQSYCVRLPAGVAQAQLMQLMLDAGVATRRGVMCIHREAAYRPGQWRCGSLGCCDGLKACGQLRHSEAAQAQSIILPLYVQMTKQEQLWVCNTLKGALQSLLERA